MIGATAMNVSELKTRLSNLIKDTANQIMIDEEGSDTYDPLTYFVDASIPMIYAKNPKSIKEFAEHNQNTRTAISLARYVKNPACEILNLWHHKLYENKTLLINFHFLQSRISQQLLMDEYEKISMQVSNEIGVDINRVVRYRHLAAPLQFICGLGPRKSQHLIDRISQSRSLKYRMEIFVREYVEKTVYLNCIAFIKVKQLDDEEEFREEVLDQTRIHPDSYNLAVKIVRDALDEPVDEKRKDE